MKNPFFSVANVFTPVWLLVFTVHVLLSLVVAIAFGRQKTICFLRLFILCLLITAPAGCAILLFYRTPKQKQHDTDLDMRVADPFSRKDHLLRLKVFRQTGMISKAEYEAEKKRISESDHKNETPQIIIQKLWKRQA